MISHMTDETLDTAVDKSKCEYRQEERRVHRICYHLVWSVRRGSPIFRNDEAKKECEELIASACRARRWEVLTLDVRHNHVRLSVQVWPADPPDKVIRVCKDVTVGLRERWQPTLPSMWTSGFLADVHTPDEEVVAQHLFAERERG